jgi:hypothetical protein
MLIVYEILLGLFELHFCLGFNRSAYLILFSVIELIPSLRLTTSSWLNIYQIVLIGPSKVYRIFVTYTPLLVPYFFSSYLKREHLWCCHCLHSRFGSSFNAVFFNWKYFKMIFYIFFSVFLSNFDMLI